MDQRLQEALKFSNFRYSFSIKQKTLKEKLKSRLTYGHGGGIFTIDRDLINFVVFLCDKDRTEGIVLLDDNHIPVLIENLEEFKNEILDRYFTATQEYHTEYSKLKQCRSVESVIDV